VDKASQRLQVYPAATDRENGPSWIYQLFETSGHHFWAASNVGLVEYFAGNEPGSRFRVYTTQNGESLHDITTLGEDLDGNLWIGTGGDGLARMAREGFLVYGEKEGIATADAFYEDAGGICVRGYRAAENRGEMVHMFGCFENERPRWFIPKAFGKTYLGWVSQHVTLRAANGEWWIGTGAGLYRFPAVQRVADLDSARPLAVYTKKDGLASLQIYYLFQDSRRRIWISTTASGSNGLSVWEPGSGKIRNLDGTPGLPSLKTDLARAFAEDRSGNVWMGLNAGLLRYRDGSFQLYTKNGGQPLGGVREVHCDQRGRLWFASSFAGLVRVDDPAAPAPVFLSYTTAQGLSSNLVTLIAEDLNGRLYLGTGRALDILEPASGRVKHLTAANGLPSLSFRTAFRDRKGQLWFGAGRGISVLAPPENKSPVPKTLITGLRISGRSRPISALNETELFAPDLSAMENQVQVDFAGLSFEPGETVRYRYKLEGGADAEWSPPTELRTVNYAELRPDKYRFLVRAENSDGVVSPTPASFTFEILPHLWQRWWFLAGAAMLAAMLVYALHRYNVRRTLEIERVRTRIAADLHDDIGSNLTQIAILSEVANQKLNPENAGVGDILSSVARISRDSVASMSDIVWAINPKRDSLLDLVRRMKRFTNEVVSARGIEFRWRAADVDQDLKLGAEVRRDVFLVFKEVINNAVRHSECSRIDIVLRVESGRLVLSIADDGKGFDPSAAEAGHGLDNIRRRAANLQGQLQVESLSSGTTIVLYIPLRVHATAQKQFR
jgi:signal transduction histidine kinase